VLVALAMAATAVLAVTGAADAAFTTARWSAPDRYRTSVAISQQTFPVGASAVVIANGAAFPDALAAGPLAGVRNAPVLLTRPDVLPPIVATEITRLAPSEIYLVGGPGAIPAEVEAEIAALTDSPIVRIAGTNRYETAAAVSGATFPSANVVYIASGVQFADAMSAGGPAGQNARPVLLTTPTSLHPSAAAEITRLGNPQVVVVGGTGAVSAAVMTQIDALTLGAVRRVNGTDRYLTNVALSQDTYSSGVNRIILVTGADFPDALGAASAAKQLGAAILLTRRDCVPAATMQEIYRLGATQVTVIGGTGAVGVHAAKLVPCGPPTTPLFSFMKAASGATTGVYSRWDPCDRPIRYQIYHEAGTTLAQAEISAVAVAVSKAAAASGMTFQYAGLTTVDLIPNDIDAYIGYVESFPDPDMLGEAAVGFGTNRLDIVVGYAVAQRGLPADIRLDTLLHEIGHLLGLGHAEDDINQLMYPFYVFARSDFQPGDLEGLRLVGATMPCFPASRSTDPGDVRWVKVDEGRG
jgi:putative cell wall-binding protein